jgi:hypothetical protein
MYFKTTECRKVQYALVLSTWCESWTKEVMSREPLVATSGAPGDGKTRFVWHLAQRGTSAGEKDLELEEALEALAPKHADFVLLMRDAVGVTVTFNFASRGVPDENPDYSLGLRMLYSHFCRDGEFKKFCVAVKNHFGRGVLASEALSIIRADIDINFPSNFPGKKRAIILAVDEVLLSNHEQNVLASISELMELPVEQKLFFPIVTHLSPERIRAWETFSQRRLALVMNTALDDLAVDRLVRSLKHCQVLLEWPSFVSLLNDCGGVPRCLEFVCLAAASKDVGWLQDRSSIVLHLRHNEGYFAKFVAGKWKKPAARALFFAFSGWVEECFTSEHICEREELFKNGFLHVLSRKDDYSKYGVPPIFCFLWCDLEERNDLLAAIIEFLKLDAVGPAPVDQGPRFELQIGALFRILSATDELVRKEGALVAEVDVVPRHRSILGLVNRPGFRCVAEAVGHVHVVPAFMCPLLPNKYHLSKHQFDYGENLACLGCGRYMPRLSNHEGFDVLLVDMCEREDSVFLTVIECKFSQEKGNGGVSSYVSMEELVKKFVDALSRYACLVEALLARRFCFIAAMFQGLNQAVTSAEFASLVVAKLAVSNVRSPLSITTQHVLDAVVLLRRAHLKHLLTPTLENRYHFFANE